MATLALKKLAFRFGYDFTLRKLPQYAQRNRQMKVPRDMEPAFTDIFEQVRDLTLTSPDCVYALYAATRHVAERGLTGDFVECGVWRGGSAMTIALTLKSLGITDRTIWLYDTFTGMTRPEAVDVRQRDGMEQLSRWEMNDRGDHNDWCYAPLDEVRSNLARTGYPLENLRFVKGVVEETIPAESATDIALLRLDTDWYRSTYHELTHLYPRLAAGGVLIIDDYGAYEGARQATDQYFDEQGGRPFFNRIDTSARLAIKPG